MRKRILIVCTTIVSVSCRQQLPEPANKLPDNKELIEMVKKDQEIRIGELEVDYESVDKVHRKQIFAMLANGLICTNQDKLNAALILQHTSLDYCNNELRSHSVENYLLAYQLSKSAFDSGYEKAAYYVATTYDRYLLYTKGFQKYGTQRVFDEKTGEELWAPIDSTTTDAERILYNVPPLDSLLKMYKMFHLNTD